jgi:hypothetical protein
MPKIQYKNKRTYSVCEILKREAGLVQVRYIPSGTRSWYKKEDFEKRFKQIK